MNKALSKMLIILREKIKADQPKEQANVDLVFDISDSLRRIADVQEKLAKK